MSDSLVTLVYGEGSCSVKGLRRREVSPPRFLGHRRCGRPELRPSELRRVVLVPRVAGVNEFLKPR